MKSSKYATRDSRIEILTERFYRGGVAMSQISSVDRNQLSPKKEKQPKPSQEFGALEERYVEVSAHASGTSGDKDRVELSPEALKILKESRARNQK